jgi:hypothetical protein
MAVVCKQLLFVVADSNWGITIDILKDADLAKATDIFG